jgi:hypothetical protein
LDLMIGGLAGGFYGAGCVSALSAEGQALGAEGRSARSERRSPAVVLL